MTYLESLREHYLEQPHEVSLETMALCNAACSFCPYPTLERKGQKMSDELISRLVDEMAAFEMPFTFSPFKVNEPLLDKRTLPLCKEVLDRTDKAVLRIFTNGSALTKDNIREIARLDRVLHLWVSLNAVDPETYSELMQMPFERTASKLDLLHEYDFPHQVVLSTVGGPNQRFRDYCHYRWPKFKSQIIKRDAWLGFTHSQSDVVPQEPCARWFELSICADGKVSLCCMDGSGDFPIGDLNTQTMLEVYNSPHWRERREKMLSRLEVYPCSTCTY